MLLLCSLAAAAQQPAAGSKTLLPGGHANIDSMVALARQQLLRNTAYAMQLLNNACIQAKAQTYPKGLADALYSKAKLETELGNFPAAENSARQSLALYSHLSDYSSAAQACECMGFALYAQSKFWDAINAYVNVINLSICSPSANNITGRASSMIGCIYMESGNYKKAFEHCNKGLQISLQTKDQRGIVYAMVILGELYSTVGDDETALDYFHQVEQRRRQYGITEKAPFMYMGGIYCKRGQYDSAMYCYQQQLHVVDTMQIDPLLKKRHSMFPRMDMAQVYLQQKQYDKALACLLEGYHFFKQGQDNNQVLRALHILGQAYLMQHDIPQALHYTYELDALARTTEARQYKRNASELLWHIYEQRHRTDSAYVYLKKFMAMNDSLGLEQSARKLSFYKTKAENEKTQARISLLENQRKVSMQRINMLAGGILCILIIGVVILRNNRLKHKNEIIQRQQLENELQLQKTENERKQAEFERHTAALKMQALRAQMNPHFIFNCLNSINRFILKNETEAAASYLTKFSRLIRLVLQNGDKNQISLAEEIDMLEVYLKLEQIRFRDRFSYAVHCDDNLDSDAILIPPMLIQPFVENAIWHGLLHKTTMGKVTIDIYEEANYLCCRVTDDGIGRKKAAAYKSKSAYNQKSFGMRITSERLNLLQEQKKEKITLQVTDLEDAAGEALGTEVFIRLPLEKQAIHADHLNNIVQ